MSRELEMDRVDQIVRTALEHAEAGYPDQVWDVVQPLIVAQREQRTAAMAAVGLLDRRAFDREHGVQVAEALFDAHRGDIELVSLLGGALECVHRIDFLNDGPPTHPIFVAVAVYLRDTVERIEDRADSARALRGLAVVARVLGRTWDPVAERCYVRVAELSPGDWRGYYNLGLFYKTRGRFAEGQAANQRAFDLGGAEEDGVRWNLGICATGARDGATALAIWKRMGQKIKMGRFGLPEGSYGDVKVRLAERPIARRNPATEPDDPGREETIWIERLSPCHGIVRSALFCDEIGVDYGDAVLFDGAPMTYHTYKDEKIPVFPHLATLERPGYRIYSFAGTQQHKSQIAELSRSLPGDAVLYVHTEQFVTLCACCWESPDVDHAEHGGTDNRVVSGKLCAPPELGGPELLSALDRALDQAPDVRVLVPDLAEAAGMPDRAAFERRRIAMLEEVGAPGGV